MCGVKGRGLVCDVEARGLVCCVEARGLVCCVEGGEVWRLLQCVPEHTAGCCQAE